MKRASMLLMFLLVFSAILALRHAWIFAYAITVDGDPSDWLADASTQAPNTGMYYAIGEYVWKDAENDDVGDGDYTYPTNPFFLPGMVDILEFRVTYDANRIYFLIKLGDVTNAWGAGEGFCGILVTIHIDEDKVTGSGQEWTAQGMDAKLDPSCLWEYVVVLHGFGSWIMDSSWTTVGWTGNGMEVKGSESNNCIEVAVDYGKIGSFIGQTWRFTVQVGFEEWGNFREVQEYAAEWSPGGGVPLGGNDWVECDAFDACFYTSTTSQTQDWSDYDQGLGNPTILCNIGEGFADIGFVHDVAVVKIVSSTTRIVAGTTVQINVTVKNEGNTYETFDVSLYYDGNLIGTQTMTDLTPGVTETLTFTWDTSGVSPCHEYTLTVIASAVPGETDLTDNSKAVNVRVGELMALKVEPPVVNGKILGQKVSVNITLNDVMPCWRVIAVQFRICYNDTLLEFVSVTEGPFLKHFAQQQPGSYGTIFLYLHDDHPLYGPSIIVGVLILPNATGYWNPPFPEGSGTIATVNFMVKYQERGLEKPKLICELSLVETDVFDDDGISLPYTIEGGIYKGWPTNIADINFDGKVDLKDFFAVALAFGEFPGRPRWNPNVDINNDQKIDLKDVYTCAKNFGWKQDPDP